MNEENVLKYLLDDLYITKSNEIKRDTFSFDQEIELIDENDISLPSSDVNDVIISSPTCIDNTIDMNMHHSDSINENDNNDWKLDHLVYSNPRITKNPIVIPVDDSSITQSSLDVDLHDNNNTDDIMEKALSYSMSMNLTPEEDIEFYSNTTSEKLSLKLSVQMLYDWDNSLTETTSNSDNE